MAYPQPPAPSSARACARRPRAGSLLPVQARAQATRAALLAAGRALMNERDFDALSIADLAAANGLSVGSFYGRFRDKDDYFAVLQQQITSEWQATTGALLADAQARKLKPGALVQRICAEVVRLARRDAGFMRSSLRRANTQPADWEPIRRTGLDMVEDLVQVLAPLLPQLAPRQRAEQVRIGMQMVYGMVNNIVIHDPGPLRLHHPRLARELARLMCLHLGLEATALPKPRNAP